MIPSGEIRSGGYHFTILYNDAIHQPPGAERKNP